MICFFSYRTHKDSTRKTLIIGLSPEDGILHFVICKVLFSWATNELFYMWAIITQDDFNFPYLIMKYMFDCSWRKDIGYLPYGMILEPLFKKAKLKVNEELQVLMQNEIIMIIVSNLHNMHLTLGDYGCWIKACTIPTPPLIQSTVGEGSTTNLL